MTGSCKQCQWPLADDDVYCGWCHNELVGYKVYPERVFLFLEDGPRTQVQLTVENQGQNPIRLQKIKADQSWVSTPEIDGQGHILRPNDAPFDFFVDVDLASPPKQVNEAKISVGASGTKEQHVTLLVSPRPEFDIEVGNCEVVLDDSDAIHRRGQIRLKTGYAHIERIQPSVPWVRIVGADSRTLDSRSERDLTFEVSIDKPLLRRILEESGSTPSTSASQASRAEVFLEVISQELRSPCSGKFTVTWTWPPILYVRGVQRSVLEWQTFQGRRRTVTLSLGNQGELPLEIAHIVPNSDTPWLQLGAARRRTEIAFPFTIPAQQVRDIPCTIDGSKLAPGEHRTSILITSNSYPSGQETIPVVALVERMPPYDGVVAVDFGTTNSCVTVFDRREPDARIIQPIVDGLAEGDAVPSVILYERLDQETKEYRIGSQARESAVLHRESVVQSIKRLLGMRRHVTVRFYEDGQRQDYSPEAIAQDIIARLLESVEDQLGQKIAECVITHPSTFAPSQLYALKRAFTNCGVRISATIHEPVAAALNYILDYEDSPPSYTLMVYDFGGGTTDIALLRVSDEEQAGQRVITPQVLGVDGRRWFGGDDVTEAIARELCRQFNTYLAPDYEGKALIQIDPAAIDAMGDSEARDMAWLTRGEIWRLAEREKIEISTAKTLGARDIIAPPLPVMYEGRVSTVSPQAANFSRNILNDLIKDSIDDTIQIMRRLLDKAQLEAPDIVLLSGQSSRLQLVEEAITHQFGANGTRIVRAGEHNATDELKACVAKGAGKVTYLLKGTPTVRINAEQMQPTATARIGIESTTRSGRPCFKEVIAAGEPVGRWKPITGVLIRRQSEIRILENSSTVDDLHIRDTTGRLRPNPEIEELGMCYLDQELPPEITDTALGTATIEMMLDERHEVALRAVIGDHTYRFATERWLAPEEDGG